WSAASPIRFFFTGGTLLALLRYGTVTWDAGEGKIDFVDKDVDVLILADSPLEWWKAIAALTAELENDGWTGCSLLMRESSTLPHELEVSQLARSKGANLFSRGVAELACALVGKDSRTLRPALVPFNAVWVQAFEFDKLERGRRWYRQVPFLSTAASVLASSPACSPADGQCVLLGGFPFQAWRGALPVSVLLPDSSCVFVPEAPLVRQILGVKDTVKYAKVVLPCPRVSVQLLRWYDRGELWGRVSGRPCLALPLVVEHDRVSNNATAKLHQRGLSAQSTSLIRSRMRLLEQLGGASLAADLSNCTFSADGSYQVSFSMFKGSLNHEADCPPKLHLGNTVDWRSPPDSADRVQEYNDRMLSNLSYVWHPHGYQLHRAHSSALGLGGAKKKECHVVNSGSRKAAESPTAMLCLGCKSQLAKVDDLCFYHKNEREVHLIFRPECRYALDASMVVQEPAKKKAKVTCRSCNHGVASELPFGPSGAPFVGFASDAVLVLNTFLSKKQKWNLVCRDEPFRRIESRSDDNFFGRTAQAADLTPSESSAYPSGRLGEAAATKSNADVRFADLLDDFSWQGLTDTWPRPYQIQAFVESLARDLLVIFPTGCGKTLVASLLLARMARLNRDRMGLFIVDRVPLVFQQGAAISMETQLRVCRVCGENKTKATMRELQDGTYDVLVVTGGAFWEMLSKDELSLDMFATVVVDEAHHVSGEHVFARILGKVRNLPVAPSRRPRILGLSASPFAALSTRVAETRLRDLQAAFAGAAVFKPPTLAKAQQTTDWVILDPSQSQQLSLDWLAGCLRAGASEMGLTGAGIIPEDFGNKQRVLDDASSLGRWRGALRGVEDSLRIKVHSQDCQESKKNLKGVEALHQVVAMMEVCLVVGTAEIKKHLAARAEEVPWLRAALQACPQQRAELKSPQLLQLSKVLQPLSADSRVLVFVMTRAAARQLCALLNEDEEIAKKFSPRIIVGQGGADGMDWEMGQGAALAAFAEGETRLLVCTSVLEEGLDVASCDLVVRFQGVNSLTSLIQSRGRARKARSRLVVMLPSQMRSKVLEMEDRERLMDAILEQSAARGLTKTGQSVPSARTEERIAQLSVEHAEAIVSPGNEAWTMIVAETANSVDYSHGGHNDTVVHGAYLHIEAFTLIVLCKGLVLRLVVFDGEGEKGLSSTHDVAFIVSVKGVTASSRYESICRTWDFQARVEQKKLSIWCQRESASARKQCVKLSWQVKEMAVGRFCGRHEFWEAGRMVDDSDEATVRFGDGQVELQVPDKWSTLQTGRFALLLRGASVSHLCIKLKLPTLAGFACLASRRYQTLYLPVTSTPVVTVCYTQGDQSHEERLVGFQSHPLLSRLAESFVVAIGIDAPDAASAESLRELLAEPRFLPVPVFDTRIAHVAEATSDADYAFSVEEPLLPTESKLAPKLALLSNLHWAVGVLCTNSTALQPLAKNRVVTHCRDLAKAHAGPGSIEAAEAAVYSTLEASLESFWADAEAVFTAAYDSMKGMPAHQINRLRGATSNGNYVLMKRVACTPSRLVLLPPAPMQSSRLLRRCSDCNFVSVRFVEEQLQRVHGTEIMTHIESVLRNGLRIGGVLFRYFGSSASQLRSHSAMFVAAEHVEIVQRLRSQILINASAFKTVAQYSSRLGLFLTADEPTLEVDHADTYEAPDIMSPSGKLLTDGAGKISEDLAHAVASDLGLDPIPSAFQFRWAGLKGVVTVVAAEDPELRKASVELGRACKLLYRPSMKKFEGDDVTFCVVSYAEHHPVFLNREIINLLTSLSRVGSRWEIDAALTRRQEAVLQHASEIFTDEDRAFTTLNEMLPSSWRHRLVHAREAKGLINEPFWLSVLARAYRLQVRDLVQRARIPIPVTDGCLAMGIPDPLGVLQEGEVFLQCVYKDSRQRLQRRVIEGAVIIYRNPCLHPGDIQKLRAVNRAELLFLENVLVLPAVGVKSVAAACSGGDLDGDKFSAIWAPDLVPPDCCMQDPLDYDAVLAEAGPAVGAQPPANGIFAEEDLVHFFVRVVVNDTLGKIAHMHLAFCDASEQGALDPLAIELAKSQSLAVDFPKTGVPPSVPQATLEGLKSNGFPDFMQKPGADTYTSSKTLGSLFRRCISLDADFEMASSLDLDPQFLLPSRRKWQADARQVYAHFSIEVGRLMVLHGLRHDKFFVNMDDITARAKASAWYEVAYEGGNTDRFRRRCFAWIVDDILHEITHEVRSQGQKLDNCVKTTEGEATAAVKKEADWDAREDEGVVTPPYLGENDDVEQPWQDLQGHAGERAPVTPDFLLEFDEDTEGTTTSGAVVA
ncbi:RDR1, partial [Symbiodinium sp. KB8]